jgi:hypothetical protein
VAKRRAALIAVFVFFFGFPLAGMLFVYWQAHATMRSSALEFARSQVPPILKEADFGSLEFLATVPLKKDLDGAEFRALMAALGDYEGIGEFEVRRSTVGARDDQAWQLVDFETTVRFSKGPARLDLRAARRSVALAEWRIERFDLTPTDMEQPGSPD